MGTSRLLLKGLGVRIQPLTSNQLSLSTLQNLSRGDAHGLDAGEKAKACIISKSSLSLSSERSPQAEAVAFQTCRSQ